MVRRDVGSLSANNFVVFKNSCRCLGVIVADLVVHIDNSSLNPYYRPYVPNEGKILSDRKCGTNIACDELALRL
jgi:hypothetical protein